MVDIIEQVTVDDMSNNELDILLDGGMISVSCSDDVISSGRKRDTPKHSLNDFVISETQTNNSNNDNNIMSSATLTESNTSTQMTGEKNGMTVLGVDPRKRVNWKQNPLVSTLFWLVGNSVQIIGCPHQDSIEKRHEIFDTFQRASDEYPQNSVLLKRKSADSTVGRTTADPYNRSIKSQSFANLEAASHALLQSKDNNSSDEYSDGQRYSDSLTSGTQSPNYGYGFYINMTPPVESFSRGGNKKGSAH